MLIPDGLAGGLRAASILVFSRRYSLTERAGYRVSALLIRHPSVRIFKNKRFARFASQEGIDDSKLREAVRDAEAGKIDADYGGGVIKQRIARPGEGKSGGYR